MGRDRNKNINVRVPFPFTKINYKETSHATAPRDTLFEIDFVPMKLAQMTTEAIMQHSLLTGFSLLTLLIGAHGAAVAQDTKQDAKAAVESVVDRASATDVSKLWSLSDELLQLGKGKPERDAIRMALKDAQPRAALVLSRALLQIEKETFIDDVASALLKVVKSNGEESEAAAAMLGSNLLTLERADQAKLVKELNHLLIDGGLPPKARISTAKTLFTLGDGEQRALAIKELKTYFRSEDPELKTEGALALASCDAMDDVRAFLRKLKEEPTDRGRLAQIMLDREEERRKYRALLDKALVPREDAPQPQQQKSATPLDKLDPSDPRILTEILAMIEADHVQGDQWKREELVAAAARGMLNELDPHSTFFTAKEYAKMIQDLKQVYAGIGAQVRVISREFTIVRPFFSAPAYKAGIRAGDRVVSILNDNNGVEGEWSTDGQPEDEVIKRLKGQPGTKLKLKVFRRGWTEPKVFPITREIIQIPLLEWEMLPGGIAFFDLLQFGEEVPMQFARELRKMQRSGELKGVVLDLRNNPGGFLEAAQNLCSIFLPKDQLVCYTEGRNGARREFKTRVGASIPNDIPVTVLMNNYSASASEITAGCLQDYGRATIIGEHSFGKGSVQQLFELRSVPDEKFKDEDGNRVHDDWESFTDENGNGKFDPGPRVKLTIERYFLPKGRNINTEYDHEQRKVNRGGIAPDITVEWPILDLGREAETQRLLADEKVNNYVREQFQKNPELFKKLASADAKDWTQYPQFEELFTSLKTWLERNDVRRILRWKVRDRVAEERGKIFPGYGFQGDVEEDPQLRQALAKLYEQNGTKFDAIPEFANLLKREKELHLDLGPKPEAELKAAAASRPAEK